MLKGKAAVFKEVNEPLEIKSYEVNKPEEGTALLELVASGVCGTDIHIHKGKIDISKPVILGHEFVGKVREISESDSQKSGIRVGDNVIVNVATPCGECLLCKTGDDANCLNFKVTYVKNPEEGQHFHGGFAEYNYAPINNMIKIPEGLDPKMVCVFACAGPTVLHAFRLASHCSIEKANVAVVQGLGPIGIFAVIQLASMGIKNILAITAGNNKKREELAKELGATEVLNLDTMGVEAINKRVMEISGGIGADVVFEGSGNPRAVVQAFDILRNRGVYLVPGQYSNSGTIEIAPQLITFKALQIIGSSQYSTIDVKNYLDFLKRNPQLHEKILSLGSCYKIDEINEAMDNAKKGNNIKTMIVSD